MLDYPFRRLFDAGCRVADMEPNIVLESQAPHTLLTLAEAARHRHYPIRDSSRR